MSDEPFEGFGPVMKGIAGKAPADRSKNTARVVDLEAYRNNRSIGESKARSQRRATYDSPELTKHEDEAMALGNSGAKRKSVFDRAMDYLGLTDPNGQTK